MGFFFFFFFDLVYNVLRTPGDLLHILSFFFFLIDSVLMKSLNITEYCLIKNHLILPPGFSYQIHLFFGKLGKVKHGCDADPATCEKLVLENMDRT